MAPCLVRLVFRYLFIDRQKKKPAKQIRSYPIIGFQCLAEGNPKIEIWCIAALQSTE